MDGTTDYSYDETNQLLGANHSDGDNPDESYQYDANGNRELSHLHGEGYVTGANNRLQSDSTYTYEYDLEGNLVRQTEIASGEVRELEWDDRNRLLAVVDRNASGELVQEVNFTYDAMNRRLSKEVDTTPLDKDERTVTYFVYDQENVLLEFIEYEENGEASQLPLVKRYLHRLDTDQILAEEEVGIGVVWHLKNHLGTTRYLTNTIGTPIENFTYDSFGNLVIDINSEISTRYLYAGREWDGATRLYYNRLRYYNPALGRFISEDPLGVGADGFNIYTYVSNRPVDTTDPLGLYGRVNSQTRRIRYRDGSRSIDTTNIRDVLDARRQNPFSVLIQTDITTAFISFSRVNTGSRPTVDRGLIPDIRPWPLDARGHIVARQLGGNGRNPNNLFAQNSFINNDMNTWRGFETGTRNLLDRLNQQPCFAPQILVYTVQLNYAGLPSPSFGFSVPRSPSLRPTSYNATSIFVPLSIGLGPFQFPNP